ncbi:MAG: GspE/PulE family protein [Planctomycetota bacterium]
MPDLLLTSVEYGGYISVIKFATFVALFFAWVWLVTWAHQDAKAVEAEVNLWTGVLFAAGAVAAILWLVIPLFLIGAVLYLVAVGATAVGYVIHRNARVMDYDRILTSEHIKGLFAGKQAKLDAMKSFVFITANKNEVPLPQPKTPDFFGYKAAYDLFNDASWKRASDIMFAPTPQEYRVAYQIDGTLLKQPSQPREQMEFLVRFLKHLADLDPNEKRKPQKAKFRIRHGDETIDWEVASAGSTAGEHLTLRQVMKLGITKLPDLGLTPDQLEKLTAFRDLKQGLFIISGPPKSGITTTLYALLRNHDAFINSINTFEREIAAELPNITQHVFSLSDTGTTTFAKKLQSIIRMGPDIVGAAGCEDSETAQVIAKAAKDMKILYVTFEANTVVNAVTKWIKFVGDKGVAVESLLGASNQRLLRKLCTECRQAYAPNKKLLRKFGLPAEKAKVLYRAGKVQYDKHGKPLICDNCQGTGFVGRTAVFEMITLDKQLRSALKQAKSVAEIGAILRGARMLYLQEQALRKVIGGVTSINEMVRVLAKTDNQKTEKKEQKNNDRPL